MSINKSPKNNIKVKILNNEIELPHDTNKMLEEVLEEDEHISNPNLNIIDKLDLN